MLFSTTSINHPVEIIEKGKKQENTVFLKKRKRNNRNKFEWRNLTLQEKALAVLRNKEKEELILALEGVGTMIL